LLLLAICYGAATLGGACSLVGLKLAVSAQMLRGLRGELVARDVALDKTATEGRGLSLKREQARNAQVGGRV